MAINYTTLFTRLGKLVKWSNVFLATQGTTLLGAAPNGEADDILSQYEARRDLVTSLESTVIGQASSVAGWINALTALANATLSDLQLALNAPGNAVATILPLLYADMVANSQSVKANTVSAPTATAAGSNTGTGKLLASKKNVNGVDDERIITEAVEAVCTADRFTGASAGAETFSLTGYPKLSGPGVYGTRGSGNGPTLRVADASNLLTDGNFATFVTTAHIPDGWTRVAGAAATNIDQEVTNVHSGSSALKLIGDGATTTVTLTQAVNGVVSPGTTYGLSIWLRKGGTVSAGSTLAVKVTGTGFSTVNVYNADPTALTTSYVNFNVFFPTGVVVPADLTVTITWTAANTAGATAVLYLADCVLATPTAFANVQYLLVRGAVDYARGDSFAVATVNGYAGIIQTYFGRFYNFQLPSNAVGGETQGDSLAT